MKIHVRWAQSAVVINLINACPVYTGDWMQMNDPHERRQCWTKKLGILKLDTWGMGMSHGPSTVGKCVPLPLTNNQKTTLTYLPYYEYYLPFILYRFHTHCWNWVKPVFIPKLHRKKIYIYIYIYYLVPVFCGPSPLGCHLRDLTPTMKICI